MMSQITKYFSIFFTSRNCRELLYYLILWLYLIGFFKYFLPYPPLQIFFLMVWIGYYLDFKGDFGYSFFRGNNKYHNLAREIFEDKKNIKLFLKYVDKIMFFCEDPYKTRKFTKHSFYQYIQEHWIYFNFMLLVVKLMLTVFPLIFWVLSIIELFYYQQLYYASIFLPFVLLRRLFFYFYLLTGSDISNDLIFNYPPKELKDGLLISFDERVYKRWRKLPKSPFIGRLFGTYIYENLLYYLAVVVTTGHIDIEGYEDYWERKKYVNTYEKFHELKEKKEKVKAFINWKHYTMFVKNLMGILYVDWISRLMLILFDPYLYYIEPKYSRLRGKVEKFLKIKPLINIRFDDDDINKK